MTHSSRGFVQDTENACALPEDMQLTRNFSIGAAAISVAILRKSPVQLEVRMLPRCVSSKYWNQMGVVMSAR